MMLLMFMLMMMLRNPTIMMIEMFSLCDVQEGIDALDNADVFLGDGIEDSHDGDDRNVLTFQEGATARLLSLGTRLSPNERDNQVLG